MAWQEVFPLNVTYRDAEEERELRLASQARAGAEWALSALVARYQPPVTRYLTRLTGDPETARTLAERIFVQMEKRLRGPHGGQHLRLWLLRACTEAGLDTLRHPHGSRTPLRLDSAHTAGLLPERAGEVAAGTLRAGLDALANLTGSTRRQVRQLIWSDDPKAPVREAKPAPPRARTRRGDTARANGNPKTPPPRMPPLAVDEDSAQQDPREALRYRMVRAVLAEIPYGDAQCLALHLVAGLNQAEVALALGITRSATRRRIVQGLQLFAQRYEAAAASLGLSMEALAPGATRTSPPLRVTTPPQIAQTPPIVAATTVPLPEAALYDGGPSPFEQQPAVAWDQPLEVAPRATGAPVQLAAAIEFIPPPPELVTIDAIAAPDEYASDDASMLQLEEQATATVDRAGEKTLIIVETTAVVHAIPVAELQMEDTFILSAPEAGAGEYAAALGLAAVEVPARPPEHMVVEAPPPALERAVEAEVQLVAMDATASEASLVTAVPLMPQMPQVPVRLVPVLTAVDTPPPMYPVRVVPVLTSVDAARVVSNAPAAPEAATAVPAAQAAPRAPSAEPAFVVRRVPVLTPPAPSEPAPLAAAPSDTQLGDGGGVEVEVRVGVSDDAEAATVADTMADVRDEASEPVVLAAGVPDGAAVEAQ